MHKVGMSNLYASKIGIMYSLRTTGNIKNIVFQALPWLTARTPLVTAIGAKHMMRLMNSSAITHNISYNKRRVSQETSLRMIRSYRIIPISATRAYTFQRWRLLCRGTSMLSKLTRVNAKKISHFKKSSLVLKKLKSTTHLCSILKGIRRFATYEDLDKAQIYSSIHSQKELRNGI